MKVEITASVAAGTTYTLVCVFADGLIAPNLLKFCGIFYIPDNMSMFGKGGTTAPGASLFVVIEPSATVVVAEAPTPRCRTTMLFVPDAGAELKFNDVPLTV